MKKLDESQIIQIFQVVINPHERFVSEDVEKIVCYNNDDDDDDMHIIVSTDTLVESTDVPPMNHTTKFVDISRKSIVAAISDFAVKGIVPKYSIISITLPKKYAKEDIVIKLAKGFQKAAKEFNLKILGGDTNQGKELSITVTLFGYTKNNKPILRKGAKTGDIICVTGQFGNAAAGLSLLLQSSSSTNKNNLDKRQILLYNKMKKAFWQPKPQLTFGIKIKKYVSSAMDSSDGLAKTLNEMSKQSKKEFTINKIPCEKALEKFAKNDTKYIEKLVFYGGEEYEMVFTVSPHNMNQVKKIAKRQKVKIVEIGVVGRSLASSKNRCDTVGNVVLARTTGSPKKIKDRGWQHFS